jgi:hypothetical protein
VDDAFRVHVAKGLSHLQQLVLESRVLVFLEVVEEV